MQGFSSDARRARRVAPVLAALCLASLGAALGAAAASPPSAQDAPAATAPGSAGATPPTVILLAWDGVRHDFPDRARVPGLERMEREGVRASRITPPFPSTTFPGMVTLATGTYPDRHGIVDNHFRDVARGTYRREADPSWIEAEPLWIAAERQGVPSAVFFWVGSEADWRGRGARHRVAPFDSGVDEATKVERILAWLDLPAAERPRLIMGWWHGTDRVGHQKGPDHPDVAAQLEEQGEHLRRLLEGIDERGLWDTTTVVVVSDHGMTAVDESVPVEERLAAAGVAADVELGGAVAHVFLADPGSLEKARAALADLPGVEVYRRDDVPDRLRLAHPQRTGDLVLTVKPPRTFVPLSFTENALYGPGRVLGWSRGMHGFDPEHPDMGGIFFAMGRGIPRGVRTGPVRAIDVAPTVAGLLGIAPPEQAEGVRLDFTALAETPPPR